MDIDLDDVDLPTTKEKEMRDDSTEIFDNHGNELISFLEDDSDQNSEVWSAFSGSRSSLPKKGDLVVYFPQGHLEYEKPHLHGLTPKEEVRTYDLQPQIICRVEHVQLMVANHLKQIKEADDEIYAKVTLHPEPEVNSEEKELEQSDGIEDCIRDEARRPATISTPSLFSKILKRSDTNFSLSIPPEAAIEFFCLDNESVDLQNHVTAMDFHGNVWKFPLIKDKKNGNWSLKWSEFTKARNIQPGGNRVVFLRDKDMKLKFGIRRWYGIHSEKRNANPLSEAAGAMLKKSMFSVIYKPRGKPADFVIPYQKYMKSLIRPKCIGDKVYEQQHTASNSLIRYTGVVTGMADLDPKNWPNSKWKCLTVKWGVDLFPYEDRVSPWEIVFDDSQSSSTFDSLPKLKRLRTSQHHNSLGEHNYLLSDEAIRLEKQKHVQEPRSINFQGGIPATLRQLKIVNCMNLKSLSASFETEKSPSINERVHYSRADILELEKLEIQNCQKLESLPKGMHKLRNLDLLSINDCCSLEYFPEGGLPITCLTSLSISKCENLKCLPNKLHKVTSLQSLSISGCPSLMFFPEGGLPPNLVSLRIIDCDDLISLSQWELHKLKHLRTYSISCGCSDSGE
ncbi:hypothetical protein Dsin_010882 [Dipteronia sinensis]|uniref:TF-B3 domain-containing protein n=1 Tax=Dipteronia sinensis TaxID=43782 RepID=A0AAE0AUJ2_9ROSI|nr:hypothetical protein Dsin_010882 [Dipteronia sinensis]